MFIMKFQNYGDIDGDIAVDIDTDIDLEKSPEIITKCWIFVLNPWDMLFWYEKPSLDLIVLVMDLSCISLKNVLLSIDEALTNMEKHMI